MNEEMWKEIEGYPNYMINNLGKVLSKGRTVLRSDGFIQTREPLILKSRYNRTGYLSVVLINNGNKKSKSIHRLVCQAFLFNPGNKPMTNHKNGIKADNYVENLEWVTAKENVHHAVKNNLIKRNHGENVHNSILSNIVVLEIKQLLRNDCLTQVDIGKRFGVSKGVINHIKTNRNYTNVN